jgi:NAD-dependent DNA ligase
MNDIGEGTAKNIYEYFHNEKNKILLQNLLSHITLEFKKEVE